MFINFQSLPATSRIWIYQSDRFLSEEEIAAINSDAQNFVEQWTAHQQTLHASFTILHNLFLILAVNQNQNDASGCSIDKSVHFIQSTGQKFNIDFFNRFNIAFREAEKISLLHSAKLISKIESGEISENISVFNNLITTKNEMESNWEIPLKQSWLFTKITSLK